MPATEWSPHVGERVTHGLDGDAGTVLVVVHASYGFGCNVDVIWDAGGHTVCQPDELLPDPHGKLSPEGQRIEDAAELRAIAARLDDIAGRTDAHLYEAARTVRRVASSC